MQKDSSIQKGLIYLDAIKANDEKALQRLYAANYPKVERYILRNSGDADQAKDIFQEAFIACWRAVQLDKFIPANETSLDGYLYRIARNKWLDHLRSAQHRKTVPLADSTEDWQDDPADMPGEQDAYIQAVKENFGKIGGNCKDILTRFYYGKASLRDIAIAMGWTEATARNNKYRCIQRLRALLNQQ